ncbi:MAG TPA: arsenosugar biosynthesis arsenite methyltransferase ArsM [Saprospiraceae bacterium]|nr:arsenosugar biosynthesis arsenite methyltransferase ArsM [Saprospiraceae bacterium]
MNSYFETTLSVYQDAAINPNKGLCCTTTPVWQLPDLRIPSKMLEMNYGCGSTVAPRDLVNHPTVLYVGVGGGMELLQFAYFNRRDGGITGIDLVDEMLSTCSANLLEAESQNPWFKSSFVDLKKGNALELPVADESIDVAAQNCLFNIFDIEDLKIALSEMYRVLKPNGRLVLSDPVADREIPLFLRQNDYLRALCLSGSLPMEQYLDLITGAGFGTVEIRARRLYRVLSTLEFPELRENIILYSIELCAIKDPMPADGPCIFTGKSALYFGPDPYFDDEKGHILFQNQPLSVCDKTARAIGRSGNPHIFISESSYHYDGGGCC